MRAATLTSDAYRRPWLAPDDDLFRRCLSVAAAAGLVFLIAVLVVPRPVAPVRRIEELPPRIARLILEKPKPPGAHATPRAVTVEAPPAAAPAPAPPVAAAEPAAPPRPANRRLDVHRDLPADAGQAGRVRAREAVSGALAGSQEALSRNLDGLTSALGSASADAPRAAGGRRGRALRGGRGEAEVASASAGAGVPGGSADLGGSGIAGAQVEIGSIAAAPSGSGAGVASGSGDTAGGAAPGVYRSNASLLAVVRRYAAGIQYCYSNELRRTPGLAGKLVVTLVVAASGQVTEASVAQNTLGSERLAACALSQIREWKFPAISEGVTTFQTPFVFTPPE